MKVKHRTLHIFFLVLFCITPAAMACCGHCHHGGQKMHKSTESLTHDDSLVVEKFTAGNSNLIEKLEKNKELIAEEYQKKNLDYDKIAELKKKGIDLHTELEKRASKEKLQHHQCWCPMHK